MPKPLRLGDSITGKKGAYLVVSSESFDGGQAKGYYVEDQAGKKLFLKMFMEPTALSENAMEFVARQEALITRLEPIPDFVCRDVEFFEHGRVFYKVSERVHGTTLQQKLDNAGSSDDREYWSQEDRRVNSSVFAYALSKLHESGIAHLDLKPDNIILDERFIEAIGQTASIAKLVDFDGAFVVGAPRAETMGTKPYLTPEHLRPAEYGEAGTHSDVFQMGIILYQLLARRFPFHTETGLFSRAAEHPCKVMPELPSEIGNVIWACLNPRPEDRPRADEVHRVLISVPSAAPPDVLIGEGVPTSEKVSPPTERVVLHAPGRKFRYWKDMVLARSTLRGVDGYDFVDETQARIFPDEGHWYICHLSGAMNRTRVNGVPIEPGVRHRLEKGDVVSVGPKLKLTVGFEPMD